MICTYKLTTDDVFITSNYKLFKVKLTFKEIPLNELVLCKACFCLSIMATCGQLSRQIWIWSFNTLYGSSLDYHNNYTNYMRLVLFSHYTIASNLRLTCWHLYSVHAVIALDHPGNGLVSIITKPQFKPIMTCMYRHCCTFSEIYLAESVHVCWAYSMVITLTS